GPLAMLAVLANQANGYLQLQEALETTRQKETRIREERDAKAQALDEKAAALQRAQGLQLTLRSELLKQTNPGLALILAVEGAKRNPGLFANNTLLAALDGSLERRTFLGHQGPVHCCAFSPAGPRLVTGGVDQTARV